MNLVYKIVRICIFFKSTSATNLYSQIFINGVEQTNVMTTISQTTATLGYSISQYSIPFYLGQQSTSDSNSRGAGVFSNLKIYDRQLSADDIKILSQCGNYGKITLT